MAQSLIQSQTQQQAQIQRLSPQQLLQVKLMEMPVNELEERINLEMDDNPALEGELSHEEAIDNNYGDERDGDDGNITEQQERDDKQSALDEALENMSKDDEMPTYSGNTGNETNSFEEMVYGDYTSFYDKLLEQMREQNLNEKQKDIMEYLIGSLDEDGLLRKTISDISDELAFNYNINASEKEIEDILHIIQTFDPAGIGARSLQECLLLQIERRNNSKLKDLMLKVIHEYFNEFTKKHWDKIQQQLNLSKLQTTALETELRKLNPKPGSSLGEVIGHNLQQITPDFIVDTEDDGTVTFSLNDGRMPELHVSQSFSDTLNEYKNNKDKISKQVKEALLYTKNKIESAQNFIEAIKQRKHTLYITMKAIIQLQHNFFEDGDEASLHPMILKDIADKTGLDASTISRVSNSKYAQTKWGTFPLKFFFNDSYTTEDGEELSTRRIKLALQEIIDAEDKSKPFSDDALQKELTKKGFPIARRTVAKYREQLHIPIARLRK